jgi:signal transduction histidine kinase
VLRIVQEALQNIEKHALAHTVAVGSALADGELRIWVRDDGVGFAPDSPPQSNGNGFGLLSLRERARLAGGTLQVESAPGTGTCVVVTIAGLGDNINID